jgi:ferredoxin
MIVADRKSLEEILDMIKEYKKILLVGCKGCVTVCNVGGSKEVGILAASLKIARKKEGNPIEIDEKTLERQCDPEYVEQIRDISINTMGFFPWHVGWDLSSCPRRIPARSFFRQSTPSFSAGRFNTVSGRSAVQDAVPASFTITTACAPLPAVQRAFSTDPAVAAQMASVKSQKMWSASGTPS